MPGRSYNANGYRFGFNGQEMDNEVFNNPSTSYTAEFWQYDSRIGRRWNIDPVVSPWESPYAVNGDNPIYYNDPNGDFKTKFGAWLYTVFNGGTVHPSSTKEGEYYVSSKVDGGKGNKGRGRLPDGPNGELNYETDEVVVAEHVSWNWGKGNSKDKGSGWGYRLTDKNAADNIPGADRKGNSYGQIEIGWLNDMLDKDGKGHDLIDLSAKSIEKIREAFSKILELAGVISDEQKPQIGVSTSEKTKEKHYTVVLDGRMPYRVIGQDTIFEKEDSYGKELDRRENGKNKNDTSVIVFPYQRGN